MPRDKRQARCDIALLVDEEVGARKGDGRFVVDRGSMEAQVLHALSTQSLDVCVVPFDPAI